jgi:hypothetical protein
MQDSLMRIRNTNKAIIGNLVARIPCCKDGVSDRSTPSYCVRLFKRSSNGEFQTNSLDFNQ